MWNFKQYKNIIFLLLLYIPTASFYLLMIPHQYLNISLIYTNIYLFIFKAGLFLIYTNGNQNIFEQQIYRFPHIFLFYKSKFLEFTMQNLLFILSGALIDAAILLIARAPIQWASFLFYIFFLFFFLEVIQLFALSGIVKRKYNLLRYCITILFLLFFLLCRLNENQAFTPLNPLGVYFLPVREAPASFHDFIAPAFFLLAALFVCVRSNRRIRL